ncbi:MULTISPECIES: TlpA family protein disulfide reductase [unclassified Tenacibaculum]|uniref:TlpA family protein disulfide reductase n=1 Tax=unclassified Tenacibaculum TaxID=2635139 RepID=UPI001F21FD91|nr:MULTISPECIES: TlpA disulfide reductase family protein [unclassified Tenacibaculum]MCF2875535.1 TlpA family protein disulfide reductase [Tenacibaculum sp. Cn5-1]MCF2935611.1 TlpA family protein disulfide reductase [Tenacibaculum sp. Cn5-34]MCG7512171.1 TlpA family protein disulfide reductase [Tenacibaculum sp. Cn5-46]
MKKIVFLIAMTVAMISCKKEPNNFVTFSGKITNKNSDSILISNPQLKFNRTIKVDDQGIFKDTMNVEDGFYRLFDGKKATALYLKNGAVINMTLNGNEFYESIAYTGEGASESSFLAKSTLLEQELFKNQALFNLPQEEFDTKINAFVDAFNKRIKETKLDSAFVAAQEKNIKGLTQYVNKTHANNMYVATKLAKGADSPKFVDYENYKGGTTSLDDLKGKYVYIDMWATWCPPCKKEIPFLQKVEKQYHNKNIQFVSISVDSEKDYQTWKNMVADKNLSGIQLYAKKDKSFANAYRVNSIPRFILIDPQGKIVTANAPRPSNPKLIELFTSLNI